MSKGMFIWSLIFSGMTSSYAQPGNYDSPGTSKQSTKIIKGWLYGSLGWHRVFYTNSTIHFKDQQTASYDFSLMRAKGIDDNDLDIGQGIDAPQWSIRFGYLFNRKNGLGIELSYDHTKYILKQGQRVHLVGTINGEYFDQDTTVNHAFIEYEHTDGANYYMASLLKRIIIRDRPAARHVLDLLFKAGAGPVIPRTESKVNGNHVNARYHLSGFVAGVESSLRYELLKNIFAEFSVKGAYANYSDVLLYGSGRASQHWWSLQLLLTLAYQLPVGKCQETQK